MSGNSSNKRNEELNLNGHTSVFLGANKVGLWPMGKKLTTTSLWEAAYERETHFGLCMMFHFFYAWYVNDQCNAILLLTCIGFLG